MLSKISRYLLPVAGAAIVALSLLGYTSHMRLKVAAADLRTLSNQVAALSAANKDFADAAARLSAQYEADLEALRKLQPQIIERVRVVERAKQEVRQNASQGDISVCAPGVSSVVERLREYEAERRLQAGGDRKKAAPRVVDMPGDSGSAPAD